MKNAVHQYEDKLLEFAYGELPSHEADAVDAHVRGCTRCAESLAQIRSVRTTMSQLPFDDAPDAGLESLLAYADQQAARNAEAQPKAWWRTMFFTGRRVATLGALAALLTVGIVAWKANQIFDPDPGMIAVKQLAEKEQAPQAAAPAPADSTAASTPLGETVADGDLQPAGGSPAQATEETKALDQERYKKPSKRDAIATNDEGDVQGKVAKASNTRRALETPKGGLLEDYSNAMGKGAGAKAEVKAEPPAPVVQKEEAAVYNTPPPITAKPAKPTPAVDLPKKKDNRAPEEEADSKVYGLAGTEKQGRERDEGGRQQKTDAPPVKVATTPAGPPPPPVQRAAPSVAAPSSAAPGLSLRSLGSGSAGAGDDEPQPDVGDRLGADKDQALRSRQADALRKANVEKARGAGQQGDRKAEIQFALEALKAGAAGGDRLELLKRLCDAYEALGEADLADPFCDALLSEFPRSSAADAVSQRRGYQQRAAPKPAERAKSLEQAAPDNKKAKAKSKPADANAY